MRFCRPQLIPLLFIIAATLTLGTLGTWQVQRLQWKNALLADIEKAQQEPVVTTLPADITALPYRNVELRGVFLNDKMMRRVGGMQGEPSGFFIQTPFKLADGRVILVNRGFAPKGKDNAQNGPQLVKGILRLPREHRPFTPENKPEENLWFYEDMNAMSQVAGAPLLPLIVEQVAPRKTGVYPIANNGKIALRNDHLHYAITWFGIMLAGLIMFAFYHRVPEKA